MRVISGKVRGLKLNAPKSDDVRPTTDRVKESLFNIINGYIIDSQILDLFAGTGSLGIECLSRGASKCVFVDASKSSIDIVKSNIKKARVDSESEVMNIDCKSAIDKLKARNEKFDVIFMDPPYYENLFVNSLEKISESKLLKEDGIIVVEHDTKEKLPDCVGELIKQKSKKYGNTTLTFYVVED
ncbi:MAG: 16S rRNA (guanine(966)-N(2))-methyltransferase RsmD [Paraclostridium sp.]